MKIYKYLVTVGAAAVMSALLMIGVSAEETSVTTSAVSATAVKATTASSTTAKVATTSAATNTTKASSTAAKVTTTSAANTTKASSTTVKASTAATASTAADESKPENGWVTDDKEKTYYIVNGEPVTGLKKIDGDTYYFADNGAMKQGWFTVNEKRMFFDLQTGKNITGWINYMGERYYADSSTGKYIGLHEIDGNKYIFNEKGILCNGWFEYEGCKYYSDLIKGLYTGECAVNGITYIFSSNGRYQSGWQDIDGRKYYFGSDGKMTVGFAEIEGDKYYFDSTGAMQTGLTEINGKKYYFGTDGKMLHGWQTISGKKYYFGTDGVMIIGKMVLGQNTYTFDSNGVLKASYHDTPYLSQVGYPTGCESASAVMLLRDAGYDTSIDYFIDYALDIGWIYTKNGVTYGPDPNNAFIGDPRSEYGYGCYAPVITKALNRILTGGDTAVDLTGSTMSELLSKYIDNGIPVAIWATINMVEMKYTSQWTIPETGELFTWKGNEHCLVLIGYDENYYYTNDPYNSNGMRAYSRSVVDSRFEVMGCQAVVITRP